MKKASASFGSLRRCKSLWWLAPRNSGRLGRAATAAVLAVCSACASGNDETTFVPRAFNQTAVESAPAQDGGWELTPNQVTVADEWAGDEAFSYTEEERAQVANALGDASPWIAADGERYESLFVLPDGTTYGRRGPAPRAPVPDDETGSGAFAGTDDEIAIGQLEQELTIGTNSANDRRARITANLNIYPQRTNGAMSSNGNTQSGGCSGTKFGPRVVLTASHCVWDGATLTTSGFWNPGQTNTTATNGSIPWSGLFFRDWTQGVFSDYALIVLQDTQAVFNLGWMGRWWWNTAVEYNGVASDNHGYPCGPNLPCGLINLQTCKDSPRGDDRCDGWMYRDPSSLITADFAVNTLSWDNDVSQGHSGSAVWTSIGGQPAVIAIVTNGSIGSKAFGPRMRGPMWDDVCDWIGDPMSASSFGSHSLCP